MSDDAEPLVRIESACTYAHLYGSLLCDCQWQLEEAIRLLANANAALLIYALDQHGRGVGLQHHLLVYEQEERGFDTVQAHQSLGLPIDARQYDEVAQIIRSFGLTRMRLLTNNPARVELLAAEGFCVQRISHEAPLNLFNCRELMIKKEKLGHVFSFRSDREWAERLCQYHRQIGCCQRLLSVIVGFRDEFLRVTGDRKTIEKGMYDTVSSLSHTGEPASFYLISGSATESGGQISLRPLAAMAERSRVILYSMDAASLGLSDIPPSIRELKKL